MGGEPPQGTPLEQALQMSTMVVMQNRMQAMRGTQ
eukprot:gene19464-6682_t